uniref:Uncharacterized protein n=1 Tax=Anguilla anguilla TaxID=7936 RepID=A0A0E9VFW5_ANGAN
MLQNWQLVLCYSTDWPPQLAVHFQEAKPNTTVLTRE